MSTCDQSILSNHLPGAFSTRSRLTLSFVALSVELLPSSVTATLACAGALEDETVKVDTDLQIDHSQYGLQCKYTGCDGLKDYVLKVRACAKFSVHLLR